jgi:hypothetical protein
METKYPVNSKMRAYGKARIDITKRAKDEQDWQENWREQLHPYPLKFADGWKTCFEYKVDDFAAEIGFFIDFLGFPSSAFSPSYAQFTSPEGDFFIGVSAVQEGEDSSSPDTLRIQFNVLDLFDTISELEDRGIVFEQQPQPIQNNSEIMVGSFRSPHGICIDLWGIGETVLTIDDEEKIGNDGDYELNDDMDDEEIDDLINNILHRTDEDDKGNNNNVESLTEGELESETMPDNGRNYDNRESIYKERTRFPNSLDKLNFTDSLPENSNRNEINSKTEKSDKISSSSRSPETAHGDGELTYQEIDE